MSLESLDRAMEGTVDLSVGDIVAKYGSKQAIAMAVQKGEIPDVTKAVMAGMAIDRITASAMQPPTTTVAQDVFTPPQPAPQMGLAAAQQMQGQPAGAGLDQIPVPEQMFNAPQGMAGGGIVAFQAGGTSTTPSFSNMYSGLTPEMNEIRQLLGAYPGETPEQRAARRREEQAMRLVEAGLGIAGGTSPYFAANLAGATPAIRGYGEDIRAQRKEDLARQLAERGETGKIFETVTANRRAAATSAAEAERARLDRDARKEISASELASAERRSQAEISARESVAAADRRSRESIASLPDNKERAADTIYNDAKAAGMPITREQALARATAALSPAPDRYNALSNRLTAANKEIASLRYFNELALQDEKDPKKIREARANFEAKRQEILRNYAISEADLKELNSAGRSPDAGSPGPTPGPTPQPTVSAPPQAAIDALIANSKNPRLVAQFDEKYGAGAANRYLDPNARLRR